MQFRYLNEQEQEEFKQGAREDYKPGEEIKHGLWHPVYVAECVRMNLERTSNTETLKEDNK